jgi:hypothetical protein
MLVLLMAMAASAQAPGTQPPAKDADPIICTRDNSGAEVGTHMRPKKVCMRKSDRDFIDQQEKAAMQQLVNDGDARMHSDPGPPRGE